MNLCKEMGNFTFPHKIGMTLLFFAIFFYTFPLFFIQTCNLWIWLTAKGAYS